MNQLIEIQYFGPIISFVNLYNSSNIIIEQYDNWQKRSFRNRCQILSAQKMLDLTVPVVGGREIRLPTREVLIDNRQPWATQHWRTLESCYNNSPYFFHYAPTLRQKLEEPHTHIFNLNLQLLEWVLEKLKWPGTIGISERYQVQVPETTANLRDRFHPANRLAFSVKPYQQVFEPFEPNLSILDLLFNLGPQAGNYLQQNALLSQPE